MVLASRCRLRIPLPPPCRRSQLATLGDVFKSTEPVRLTEEDTEYSVFCVKHVFESHLVLQFNCTNTVPEQVLEGCSVVVDLADAVRGRVGAEGVGGRGRCAVSGGEGRTVAAMRRWVDLGTRGAEAGTSDGTVVECAWCACSWLRMCVCVRCRSPSLRRSRWCRWT